MITTGERQDPFEIMDIYNTKILANQSIAAIRRVIRNHSVDKSDIPTFKKLSNLLETAYNADQTVFGAKIRASSKNSMKVLSQTIKAMEGKLKDTSTFRNFIDELRKTSLELSSENVTSNEKLIALDDFCKRYHSLQKELIKQRSSRTSFGASVWPFAKQIRLI